MLHRHAISDADWDRIQHLLPGQRGQHDGIAKDNRLFLDAVLYVARTGIPWEDLPPRFGNWNSQWRRFDRWANKGRWDPILAALRDPDLDVLILDSTAVRAHPCAAGAKKSGTAPAARTIRRWAAAGAGSAPRSTGASTAWGTPSSCS
jgi:transposase